mgnify:CR=1 FL=1
MDTYTAKTDKNALTKAKKIGKENQLQHEIEDGVVKFEFVGVLELIELMDQDEVWYQLIDKVTKNNSFKYLIPNESELDVFKKIPKGKPKAW